jgi:hypothetical protein
MLVNSDNRSLTVLRVSTGGTPAPLGQEIGELSYEFRNLMEELPASVRERIDVQIVGAPNPVQTVVEASQTVDLTIAGTSRAWGIERQTLGRYTDQLASQCRSSLLITRRYSKVTSHLASVLSGTNEQVAIDTDKSGVGA